MGGVFAVGTVIPGKIHLLSQHLLSLKRFALDEVLEHSRQVLGCFLVLSVLIWASKSEPHPVRPLWRTHTKTGTPCWSMSLVWWLASC